MSVNRYRKHVLLLPEDDAIRQMANGFLLAPSVRTDKVQIQRVAGGWQRAVDEFEELYVSIMGKFPLTHLIILIDLDGQTDRLDQIRTRIPAELEDQVFIIGIGTESEDLRKTLGISFEDIGKQLAADCRDGTDNLWGQELLRQNAPEVSRLREYVYPILFGDS